MVNCFIIDFQLCMSKFIYIINHIEVTNAYTNSMAEDNQFNKLASHYVSDQLLQKYQLLTEQCILLKANINVLQLEKKNILLNFQKYLLRQKQEKKKAEMFEKGTFIKRHAKMVDSHKERANTTITTDRLQSNRKQKYKSCMNQKQKTSILMQKASSYKQFKNKDSNFSKQHRDESSFKKFMSQFVTARKAISNSIFKVFAECIDPNISMFITKWNKGNMEILIPKIKQYMKSLSILKGTVKTSEKSSVQYKKLERIIPLQVMCRPRDQKNSWILDSIKKIIQSHHPERERFKRVREPIIVRLFRLLKIEQKIKCPIQGHDRIDEDVMSLLMHEIIVSAQSLLKRHG